MSKVFQPGPVQWRNRQTVPYPVHLWFACMLKRIQTLRVFWDQLTQCSHNKTRWSNFNWAFHLNREVGISEFWDGNFNLNASWSWISDPESLENLTNPVFKIQVSCFMDQLEKTLKHVFLFKLLSNLCVFKSVTHTVLSNLYLWTCCFSVCKPKLPCDVALSTGIANNC